MSFGIKPTLLVEPVENGVPGGVSVLLNEPDVMAVPEVAKLQLYVLKPAVAVKVNTAFSQTLLAAVTVTEVDAPTVTVNTAAELVQPAALVMVKLTV